MNSQRILGLALLAVGIVVFVFGLNASDSVTDTVKEGLTGRFTDTTMWYLVGGVALAAVGAGMSIFGGGGVRNAG